MENPKFCFQCGLALQNRYPGCYLPEDPPEYIRAEAHLPPDQRIHGPEHCNPWGNPEDGPKSLRCPAGHETLDERVEMEISLLDLVALDDYLNAIQEGQRETAEDPEISPEVQAAALTINRYRNELDEARSRWGKEQEREAEAAEDAELARYEVGKMVDDGDLPEAIVKAGSGWFSVLGKKIFVARYRSGWFVVNSNYQPNYQSGEGFADKAEQISAEIAKLDQQERNELMAALADEEMAALDDWDELDEISRQSSPFPPHPDDNPWTPKE